MPILKQLIKYCTPLCTLACLLFFICIPLNAQGSINNDTVIVSFISDTQDPILFENLYMEYNNNSNARNLIFKNIVEQKAQSVIHLGDLVSAAFLPGSWKEIDSFKTGLHNKKIKFYPVPGNHEYFLFPGWGISTFRHRFPYASITGYKCRVKDAVIILLNSNADYLTGTELKKQLEWYRNSLKECEADTSVHFVIVGCHHSPYTNSKIVEPSEYVTKFFVPDFLNAKKTRFFISGHAHSFEHFMEKGKDFFVIGGGGGLQQPLKTGIEKQFNDLYADARPLRMFHFLNVKLYDNRMLLELKMMKNDFTGFDIIPLNSYTFE